jgi:hypothetical protein
MPRPNEDLMPLLIRVGPFGWGAITAGNPTPREQFLANEIKLKGGIDLSVSPGMYWFNIAPDGESMSLTPYVHKRKFF